jgi:Glycosyl hydrolase family 47
VLTLWLQTHFLCMSPGTDNFGRLAARAVDVIMRLNATGGLPPFLLDPVSGAAEPSAPISLGARGDSYVEYLLKGWLVGGKRDDALLRFGSLQGCCRRSPQQDAFHSYHASRAWQKQLPVLKGLVHEATDMTTFLCDPAQPSRQCNGIAACSCNHSSISRM